MLVGKECPVCRAPLNAFRTFWRPAWSRWRCDECGSLIGMHTSRRLLAIAIWTGVLLGWIFVTRRSGAPEWVSLTALGLLCFATIAFIDRVIVIERVGFHCSKCGYDLRETGDEQCPECGTVIDADLRRRASLAADRAERPKATPLARWGFLVAIVLVSLTLLAVGITRFLGR
jgi:hypothetical protein